MYIHTLRHCSSLLPTAPYCSSRFLTAHHCSLLLPTAPHCSSLLLTAPNCRMSGGNSNRFAESLLSRGSSNHFAEQAAVSTCQFLLPGRTLYVGMYVFI